MKSEFEHIRRKRIVQPRYRRANGKSYFVLPRDKTVNSMDCSICGQQPRRLNAKFCAVCGHNLRHGYTPLDSLKASYNLHDSIKSKIDSPPDQKELQKLFDEEFNGAASTAMAFVVYSLVPYLGILFCPGALISGCIGLAASFQKPQIGGRQTAVLSLLLGTVLLVSQTLLWWLLYVVPTLKK